MKPLLLTAFLSLAATAGIAQDNQHLNNSGGHDISATDCKILQTDRGDDLLVCSAFIVRPDGTVRYCIAQNIVNPYTHDPDGTTPRAFCSFQ